MCLVCGLISCFESGTVTAENQADSMAPADQGFVVDLPRLEVHQSGHSVSHYEETRHVYAQMIESQEVWDFTKVSAIAQSYNSLAHVHHHLRVLGQLLTSLTCYVCNYRKTS